jgi:hypothetical protein
MMVGLEEQQLFHPPQIVTQLMVKQDKQLTVNNLWVVTVR